MKYNAQGGGSLFASSTINGPAMMALNPVPEPSTFALFISGISILATFFRIKNKESGDN
ncbi:MAG: PEP-CTERM sorting domain-containing protein [Verrucomicrobiota bacterium]